MKRPMFKVLANPVAGFDIVGATAGIIIMQAVHTIETANEFVRVLNETVAVVEHEWQHVVADIMNPICTNWETHIGPQTARERGAPTALDVSQHAARLAKWLRLWLGDAESIINDPLNSKRSDGSLFWAAPGSKPVTYGQVKEMLQFFDVIAGSEPDLQMMVGGNYTHADGGMYQLIAIDVDHKGEDGVWRPGVLYQPTMNGVDGDTRMKTTTVERWRDRFVFAG